MAEIDGYYNDDKLNSNLTPKPALCLSCKKDTDPEEELLCTVIRLDQQNQQDFHCYAFEK